MKLLKSLGAEFGSLHHTIKKQGQQIERLERTVEQKNEEIAHLVAQNKTLKRLKGLPGGSNPQRALVASVAPPCCHSATNAAGFVPTVSNDKLTTAESPPASNLRSFMRPRGATTTSRPTKLTPSSSKQTMPRFQVRGPYNFQGLPHHYINGLLSPPARDEWGMLLEPPQRPETPPDSTTRLDNDSDDSGCPPEPETTVQVESRPEPPADGSGYSNWIEREPALAICFQNHSMAFDLARLALDLGKEALWHYAKARCPELWERLSPISPVFIRACWGELNDATLSWSLAPEIKWELNGFSQLRNFVAHPDPPPDLAAYDKFVRLAEALILRIGDETRLETLRGARQALREEAMMTVSSIETRGALAQLQPAHIEESSVWDPPHIDMFNRLLFLPEYQRANPNAVHPMVLRIAEEWGTINAVGEKEEERPMVTTLDIRYPPPSW